MLVGIQKHSGISFYTRTGECWGYTERDPAGSLDSCCSHTLRPTLDVPAAGRRSSPRRKRPVRTTHTPHCRSRTPEPGNTSTRRGAWAGGCVFSNEEPTRKSADSDLGGPQQGGAGDGGPGLFMRHQPILHQPVRTVGLHHSELV